MRIEVTLDGDNGEFKVFRKLQNQHITRNGLHRAFVTYKRQIIPVAMRGGRWIGYYSY